ncbi:hypothetical protein HanPSC8_Chr11g0487601 [Helianthus annuus]|nr:hypothetical protein HanPSC8_Chr11g0487601 [Helianthus annuus]
MMVTLVFLLLFDYTMIISESCFPFVVLLYLNCVLAISPLTVYIDLSSPYVDRIITC